MCSGPAAWFTDIKRAFFNISYIRKVARGAARHPHQLCWPLASLPAVQMSAFQAPRTLWPSNRHALKQMYTLVCAGACALEYPCKTLEDSCMAAFTPHCEITHGRVEQTAYETRRTARIVG